MTKYSYKCYDHLIYHFNSEEACVLTFASLGFVLSSVFVNVVGLWLFATRTGWSFSGCLTELAADDNLEMWAGSFNFAWNKTANQQMIKLHVKMENQVLFYVLVIYHQKFKEKKNLRMVTSATEPQNSDVVAKRVSIKRAGNFIIIWKCGEKLDTHNVQFWDQYLHLFHAGHHS